MYYFFLRLLLQLISVYPVDTQQESPAMIGYNLCNLVPILWPVLWLHLNEHPVKLKKKIKFYKLLFIYLGINNQNLGTKHLLIVKMLYQIA